MMFMIGGAVFFHATALENFIDNIHGKTNDLLKAVSLDIKEDLYKAGAKALGLISKFLTTPLWRLIEAPGHILDMNEHFKSLIDFLDGAANDPVKMEMFMTGELTPFESELDDRDEVTKQLVESNRFDEIVLPLLQNIIIAVMQMFHRMIPEHLPGGEVLESQ